jgi:hypothetical protein
MYLAEKTGKFLPTDMAKKYDVLQWLIFQVTGVGPSFGQFFHFKMFAPKDKDHSYSMARFQTEVKRLYEVLEKRLGQVPYLGGDEYSIADIATFPWTRNHDIQGVKWEDNPNLARWFKAIDERPAVKAALAKVGADQIEPRHRHRRSEGSLLQSRQVREGVVGSFSSRPASHSLSPPAGRGANANPFSRCIRTRVIVTASNKTTKVFALRTDLRQRMPAVAAGILTIRASSRFKNLRTNGRKQGSGTPRDAYPTSAPCGVRRAQSAARSPLGVPPRLSANGSISSQGSTWARLRDTQAKQGGFSASPCGTSSDAPRTPVIVPAG